MVTYNKESACREGQVNKNRQAVTMSIVFAAVFLEPRRIPSTEEVSNDCLLSEGITSRRGGDDLCEKKAYLGLAGIEMHRQKVERVESLRRLVPGTLTMEGRWGAATVLECGKGWIRFGLYKNHSDDGCSESAQMKDQGPRQAGGGGKGVNPGPSEVPCLLSPSIPLPP